MDEAGVVASAGMGRDYSERTVGLARRMRRLLLERGEMRGVEIQAALGIASGGFHNFIHVATFILPGLYETDNMRFGINADLERVRERRERHEPGMQ